MFFRINLLYADKSCTQVFEILGIFTALCGFVVQFSSLVLKYVTLSVNGLALFLNFDVLFLYYGIYGNANFSISKAGGLFIFSSICFLISNSYVLTQTNHKYLKKIISQNLILSTTFFTILWGARSGFDQTFVFETETFFLKTSLLTTLSVAFMRIVKLCNDTTPYWNKFDNSLQHKHFLETFCLNLLLITYNMYFDFMEIKTWGLFIWVILFFGSTFWQLYSLDNNDSMLLLGNLLNRASSSCKNEYNKYFKTAKNRF